MNSTQPILPRDLIDRGFVLITRNPPRMYAVSPRYGCTLVCFKLEAVVRSARRLVAWCEMQEATHDNR